MTESAGKPPRQRRRRNRLRERTAEDASPPPSVPPPPPATPVAPVTAGKPARKRRPNQDAGTERGLRDLVGAGRSQIGVDGALRGRDVNRPTEADLAEAERDVVVVRRNWKPATPP